MSIQNTFANLSVLYMLIAVGYCVAKFKVISREAIPGITSILMQITMPCTVFIALQRPYDASFLHDSLIGLVISFSVIAIITFLGYMAIKLLKIQRGNRGSWMLPVVFSNGAFIGYPMALAVFGNEGLSLAAIFNIPFCLLFYSLGIYFLASDSTKKDQEKMTIWQILRLPLNVFTIIGILFFAMQWELPDIILSPMTILSGATTPLAMVIVGMTLSNVKVKDIFGDKIVIFGAICRLVVFPAVAFLIVSIFNFSNSLILGAMLAIHAAPSSATSTAMSGTYGGNAELSAKIIFVTSVASMFTLPMWFAFC